MIFSEMNEVRRDKDSVFPFPVCGAWRSPNFNERPPGAKITWVVIHHTAMLTVQEALARLCSPESKVSCHYLIAQDGSLFQNVPDSLRAWHAGESYWRGLRDVNGWSIGIELDHPGHPEKGIAPSPFPERQIAALTALCMYLKQRYALSRAAFLAHSDVAPFRKKDPGEFFPWALLAESGIGDWPLPFPPLQQEAHLTVQEAQRLLAAYGYDLSPTGVLDHPTQTILTAFQRHFCPAHLDGHLNPPTQAVLAALHRRRCLEE